MREIRVGIVTCASMHDQIIECATALEGSFKIYPIIPACTFSVKVDLLRHYLDKSITENDVTILAYGVCHPHLMKLLAEYNDKVVRFNGSNCYEMFLGTEKYTEYCKKIYWMLNKPFFTKFKKDLLAGFDVGTNNCKVLIGATYKKLIYVKFENDQLDIALVGDFASTIGLEYEIHLTHTTNLMRLLKEALASVYPANLSTLIEDSPIYPDKSELQIILENIGEIIYKIDIHSRKFSFISPQVTSILGYTPLEFKDIMNDYSQVPLYHEDDRGKVLAGRYNFLIKCVNKGLQEPYEVEYRMKHKSGNVLWVLETIYPHYSPEGYIESFVGKIEVITERKKAEEKLYQFISTVSHELRTPLTVMGQSALNLKKYKDRLSEQEKTKLNEIMIRNVAILVELVEDLLIISRIDEKRVELIWKEYRPLNLILEITHLMEFCLTAKGITIEVAVDTDLQLFGDEKRVSQIFRNLIDNAIKFSPEKSKIEIKAIDHYKGIYNPQEFDGVLFQFKDFGIGIRKKDLPRLFQRFFRTDDAIIMDGTGLGLSITKELIKLHNGEIFVESKYGKGSTFLVFFPRLEHPL